nr:NADH dehydrogenase subunit 6 [Eriocampa ovata]
MFKFLMLIIFSMSYFFLSSNNPLSMGLILLIQTLLIVMVSGIMSISFWYSYILFLVMLGGMLILFIYVTSLIANQKFNISKKNMMINLFYIIWTFSMIITLNENSFFNLDLNNMNSIELTPNFLLKMSLNKLYNYPTNYLMVIIINYLLLTLFIVVKIINIKMGSLRKKN